MTYPLIHETTYFIAYGIRKLGNGDPNDPIEFTFVPTSIQYGLIIGKHYSIPDPRPYPFMHDEQFLEGIFYEIVANSGTHFIQENFIFPTQTSAEECYKALI